MAADSNRGKLSLLLFFLLLVISDSLSIGGIELNPEEHDRAALLDRHQVQIDMLEKLVRNLGDIVARLESQSSESPKVGPPVAVKQIQEGLWESPSLEKEEIRVCGGDDNDDDQMRSLDVVVDTEEIETADSSKALRRPVTVTKFSPFWGERFQFVSAVRLDSDATCIHVLPFRDYEGFNKYVAVGDEKGRVYVFLRSGDVALEFHALDSAITAMVSYVYAHKDRRSSTVITGHKNGVILMHRVWEWTNGEEWSSLQMESVGQFGSLESGGKDGSEIRMLEVHHAGRVRYILSTDVSGRIGVFRENGTVYGSAVPSRKPLAFLKQRLLFLTENGAGSLDLRTMKIQESECEGLNNSSLKSCVFDATERSKAYGYTSKGDLIHVVLLGDVMNFKCMVRSMRKLDIVEPLLFHTIKGYLLVVNQEKVSVYNVSSHHYARAGGAPRLLFSTPLDEIRSSFLNPQAIDEDTQRRIMTPLIASDREKLVVLNLGDGYVGIYRSNLPIYKGELGTILWTSPVLFFILFLFGAWYFFSKKKEAWGLDEPFNISPRAAVNTSSGPGDRGVFADTSSRDDADIMDVRGGCLRGPTRRYSSQSPYPSVAAANSFQQGAAADHNPRLATVDPNYRSTSELKFRGPNMERRFSKETRGPICELPDCG